MDGSITNSSDAEFHAFFRLVTGFDPYPWQARLALRPDPARVITAPTGTGKTEAVLVDWLWRRRTQRATTPRRLVLAMPMRVLVEQTLERVRHILGRSAEGDPSSPAVRAYTVMGGEVEDDWTLSPEDPAVLVGTIDMLISRALNRGFARGRARWPIDFGLLGSDCQWVMDEVQLMDAAVATSAQLQGFRDRFGLGAPGRTTWMSATIASDWLGTRDHPAPAADDIQGLDHADGEGPLGVRLTASKALVREPAAGFAIDVAADIALREHQALITHGERPLTIVMVNTVKRAIDLYDALRGRAEPDLLLLHSRFRPPDRRCLVERLLSPHEGRIVISTQVIEAGVDIDADAMVTDLAPWASLVQRAGRLNRAGLRAASRLVWLDAGEEIDDAQARPYAAADLLKARAALLRMAGFSPNEIASASGADAALLGARPAGLLLRRSDLLDLFDTDPTLEGDDVEVGRFIRASPDLDLSVAWRNLLDGPKPTDPLPTPEELCPAPIGSAKAIAKLNPWRWSYARRRWESPGDAALRPGDLLLVHAARGGYDPERGLVPESGAPVAPVSASDAVLPEGDADDPASARPEGGWISVAEHTDHVVDEVEAMVATLDLDAEARGSLLLAARLHDAGKAHKAFQERLREAAGDSPDGGPWAKAPRRPDAPRPTRAFRHEVASALILLEREGRRRDADLAAYLVAAHHGKMRLIPRVVPDDLGSDRATCLGVQHGDQIPSVDLGGGTVLEPMRLDLSLLEIGSLDSVVWAERSLDLLDRLGPFRLGYLEALLRAADQRASRREAGGS